MKGGILARRLGYRADCINNISPGVGVTRFGYPQICCECTVCKGINCSVALDHGVRMKGVLYTEGSVFINPVSV